METLVEESLLNDTLVDNLHQEDDNWSATSEKPVTRSFPPGYTVIGLDLGSHTIKAAVVTAAADGTLSLAGLGRSEHTGIRNGKLQNLEKVSNAIYTALYEAMRKLKDRVFDDICVSVNGVEIQVEDYSHGIARPAYEEPITVVEVARVIAEVTKSYKRPGDKELLHVLPTYYTFEDDQLVHEPVGHFGSRLDARFKLILAPKLATSTATRCLENNQIHNARFMQAAMASALTVLSQEEMRDGVALVDIGAQTTQLAVFADYVLQHLVVLPMGAQHITVDIMKGCAVSEASAEKLKLNFGHAIPEETDPNAYVTTENSKSIPIRSISVSNLSRIISARIDSLITTIDMELETRGLREYCPSGIVLAGGGSNLNGISDVFQFLTGLPTRRGSNDAKVSIANPKGVTDNLVYSNAIGLALSGFLYLDEREANYTDIMKAGADDKSSSSAKSNLLGSVRGIIGKVLDNTGGIRDLIKGLLRDDELPRDYNS